MKNRQSEGSALVVVLGILSVMMLMAIAFSMFTRTERSGTTNLKNSFVARQSLQTALSRALEAVDLSFDNPSNNWAVPVWREPYLASSSEASDDYFHSRQLDNNENAEAKILNAEMAACLTPAQLALVRSADVQWAPIYASIGAKGRVHGTSSGIYGEEGRVADDALIGRYAFVVLDTTGLLDMNKAGYDQDSGAREDTSGEDPSAFILPTRTSTDYPLSMRNAKEFLAGRRKAGSFFSTADMISWTALQDCDRLGIKKGDYPSMAFLYPGDSDRLQNSCKGTADDGPYFPADLFSGVTTSLDEITPEGHPKIPLPDQDEIDSWDSGQKRNFARRTLGAMTRIFARSRSENRRSGTERAAAEDNNGNYEPKYRFFPNKNSYEVSRPRLATVALLDALDDDSVPGQWGSFNAWQDLDEISDLPLLLEDGTFASVDDPFSAPVSIRGNPLNFPMTEPAPALSMTWAFMNKKGGATYGTDGVGGIRDDIEGSGHVEGDPVGDACAQVYKQIEFEAKVGASARLSFADARNIPGITMDMSYDILLSNPEPGSVSKISRDDTSLIEYLNWGGTSVRDPKKIYWEVLHNGAWNALFDLDNNYISGSKKDNSGNWVLISRGFGVEDTKQFRVRCYAKDWPKQAEDGTWVGTWQFYEPTLFEEDPSQTPNANATDVYLPVRMKVTISNKDGDIQQVPAPALDDGDKSYWIRMNMGIVHTSGTETHVKNPNGSKGGLSVGWAMCAAPYFAFDTSSLYTDTRQGQSSYPEGMLVWMNDFVCRSMGEKWTDDLIKKMDEDGESAANDMMTFGGQAAPRFNILQQDYLFSAEYNEMPFTSWTMHRGKTCPDMAHTLVSGDQDTQLGEQDQAGSSFFSLNELMDREMPNGAFLSLGELGGVSCGPYETLSLFQTFRWTQDMVNGDFHRVFDYFTLTKQRAPDAKNIELNSTTYDPTANAVQFPAVHNGRVNLNAPQLVYYEDTVPPRATVDGAPCNPYPIASVFNGAAYRHSGGTASNTVTEAEALNLAINLISAFDTEATRIESKRFKTSRRVVSRLSDIGMAADYDGNGEERSPILDAMLNDFSRKPVSDAERESLLNSVINGFTTRGQSYLILLRADAYTPNYGYEDSTSDGTTLATTRAIVEVFRDPEPARMTDGSLVEDKDGPVAYHNWLIRSYRVF